MKYFHSIQLGYDEWTQKLEVHCITNTIGFSKTDCEKKGTNKRLPYNFCSSAVEL